MAKPDGQKETRLEMYGETLPELPCIERLPDLWVSLGCATEGFAGATPVTWRDIEAFNTAYAAGLAPIESQTLLEMSRAYCAEIRDGNPLRKPPMERDL